MKTADEWRQVYYEQYHEFVPPASYLDDVLMDMEELEAKIRWLEAVAITAGELTDNP